MVEVRVQWRCSNSAREIIAKWLLARFDLPTSRLILAAWPQAIKLKSLVANMHTHNCREVDDEGERFPKRRAGGRGIIGFNDIYGKNLTTQAHEA
jgi:hypothetical protein